MANTYTQIYIHVVFAVEGRQNLIAPEHNDELQKYITGIVTPQKHTLIAIIGTRYIEEYYQTTEPFSSGRPPNGDILKRLALLFDPFQYEDDEDYTGNRELAVWVCKFALAFGVSDGTKKGCQGRLQNLEQLPEDSKKV